MHSHEFQSFPRLPKELQLQIWEDASTLVLPRIIHLVQLSHDDSAPIMSRTPDPPLLHVCRDSRDIMLRNWRFLFGTAMGRGRARIPFNSELDSIYMDDVNDLFRFISQTTIEDRQAVKRTIIFPLTWGTCFKLHDYRWTDLPILLKSRNQLQLICETLHNDFPNTEKQAWLVDVIPMDLCLHPPRFLAFIEDKNRDVFRSRRSLPIERFWSLKGGLFETRPELKMPIQMGRLVEQDIGVSVDTWGYALEDDGADPEDVLAMDSPRIDIFRG